MSDTIDISRETSDDLYLRKRRRMLRWVSLVCCLGLCACLAVLLWGRQRQIYADHYDFRRAVVPGISAEQVMARFGEPYRVFYSQRSVGPILAGRGRYQRFDTEKMPGEFSQVLHYRTTIEHGEFVFVDAGGVVLAVVTGRGQPAGR